MRKFCFVFLFFSLFLSTGKGQSPFRIMFYNVENLFDTEDDPQTNDNEFLPQGTRYWNSKRYRNKLNNISKVITSLGEWESPALIGMCEVENEKVMNDLITYSPLKSQQYRYVITESKDQRGIDVALMYQRDRFRYIKHEALQVTFPKEPSKKTRDILYVSGMVLSGDTLDIFVCHFPSRRGGELASEENRVMAASIVRSHVDSLMSIRRNAYIVIMGDFNDEPSNKSISGILNAQPVGRKEVGMSDFYLYNLFSKFENSEAGGSYKFRRQWNMLDQIIVSKKLLDNEGTFYVLPDKAAIFKPDFLLTEDKTHGGKRPKKTYHGIKYEGGFSDHLPIWVDFIIRKTFH